MAVFVDGFLDRLEHEGAREAKEAKEAREAREVRPLRGPKYLIRPIKSPCGHYKALKKPLSAL